MVGGAQVCFSEISIANSAFTTREDGKLYRSSLDISLNLLGEKTCHLF
jgi:hypothetical protein